MEKMKLKKKIKIKFINKIILIIILLIIAIFFFFNHLNKKVFPFLLNYSEIEIRKLSNSIISKAISEHINDDLNVEKLFIINKDNHGNITSIDFDSLLVNSFLTKTTNHIQLYLKQMEQGNINKLHLDDEILFEYQTNKKGIIFEIPIGIAYKNTLLSNLGPRIPVKLNIVGDITSNIKTKVTNYGINNALIEVFIIIKIDEQVVLPFTSKKIKVKNNIPVAIKMIQGNIPNYYFNGLEKHSS